MMHFFHSTIFCFIIMWNNGKSAGNEIPFIAYCQPQWFSTLAAYYDQLGELLETLMPRIPHFHLNQSP